MRKPPRRPTKKTEATVVIFQGVPQLYLSANVNEIVIFRGKDNFKLDLPTSKRG